MQSSDIITRCALVRLISSLVISLPAVLALYSSACCVPACPGEAIVEQPDGTPIHVVLRGDERFHWNEDPAGYLIKQSPETKQWVYAVEMNGAVLPTEHIVGREDPQALQLPKPDILRMQAAAMVESSSQVSSPEATPETATAARTGVMKNLVVLVNFSDLAITYTRQQFDDLFNQIGYTYDGAVGSVKDFYNEISYNALTVESTVVEPVTLSHGYAYYGANDSGGSDLRPREMVSEALQLLYQRGFDFRTVDGDGDGWVDGLTIIHAGGGEEYSGNDTNYIWSHEWSLAVPVTYDGIKMQMYHTEPARRGWDSIASSQGITRIGVICHETGHFLGLPDLYDTGYDSKGIGSFCLMANGSWGGNYGNRPVHMCAWCLAYLGWITPTVITVSGNYSLGEVETSRQIYKMASGGASSEYFLVENRQGVGFDQSLPGSQRGLLIWHIDDSVSNNNNQAHYKVDLEEASCTQHLETNANTGDDSDYFRYGNATAFNSTTCPNSNTYSGAATALNILNVGTTGATMTFTIAGGVCGPPSITSQPATTSACSDSTMAFSVGASGSDLHYQWQSQPSTGGAWTNVGSDSSQCQIYVTSDLNGYSYRCIVSNTCGSQTSDAAILIANPKTSTTDPIDQSVMAGSNATFSVTASGYGSFTYKWMWQASSGDSWYDLGVTTSTLTFTATVADNGKKYRCVVTGGCGSAGSNPAALTVLSPVDVKSAKLLADGQQVGISAEPVTYADSSFFYVEDETQPVGIRVEKAAHGVSPGDRADIIGLLSTNSDKERLISATTVTKHGSGIVSALGLANAALGGGDWQYNDLTHAGQAGASGASGLNNVGLLVRTWGRYAKIDASTFTLTDGSSQGITCTVKPDITLSSDWIYVSVTGVCSLHLDGALYRPVILVSDIHVIE